MYYRKTVTSLLLYFLLTFHPRTLKLYNMHCKSTDAVKIKTRTPYYLSMRVSLKAWYTIHTIYLFIYYGFLAVSSDWWVLSFPTRDGNCTVLTSRLPGNSRFPTIRYIFLTELSGLSIYWDLNTSQFPGGTRPYLMTVC